MLISLRIIHFAIVKELELDFSKGMTAFTGETGAGKSIIIDALMLALGERADSSLIRQGEERCEVTATFRFEKGSEPDLWLQAHDIHHEYEVILRRQLYAEGRSKLTINAEPFPLQKVKELSERLVHIHGQHQHQTLMQHQTHRQQLDVYAGHDALVDKVKEAYKICLEIKQRLDKLTKEDKQEDKLAFYQFQLEELLALNPKTEEIESLNQEHQLLHHAKDYLDELYQALGRLAGEEEPTVFSYLNQISQNLSKLPSENSEIQAAIELIHSAQIHCEEAQDVMQRFVDQIDLDPKRLVLLEERLSALHQIARKYHIDIKQLPAFTEEMAAKVAALQGLDSHIAELNQAYENALATYNEAAALLTAARKKAAAQLGDEITVIIQQLGMPQGILSLAVTPLETMQAHGLDKVEYQVRTNPGMPADALNKIASGGELSRISLAIQMICAQRGATPTLIFDEVDVGIGGATAALVGRLLRKLGQRLQIFCVTHQPQVAALAHAHFVVEKYTEANQTYSRIIPLQWEEKVLEIARMLSGLAITAQTKLHAEELLAEAEEVL